TRLQTRGIARLTNGRGGPSCKVSTAGITGPPCGFGVEGGTRVALRSASCRASSHAARFAFVRTRRAQSFRSSRSDFYRGTRKLRTMRIAARRHHARKFFAALLSLLTFLTIFPRRAALAQIATALKSEETFPRKAAARQPFRVETLGQIEDGTR